MRYQRKHPKRAVFLRIIKSIIVAVAVFSNPSFGDVKKVKPSIIPDHKVITTSNGVKVYYFESNIPVFEVLFSYKVGADADPLGKSGLSLMTSQMLRRGVQGLDETQITAKLDDEAAGFDAEVGEERTSFEAFGLNRNAPGILDLLFRILKQPTFPENTFRRLKVNQLEGIKQMPDLAAVLAGHVLDLTLLNGTPKVRPLGGFKRDVEGFNVEDLKSFYRNALPLDRLQVLIIGGKHQSDIADGVIKQIESIDIKTCQYCGKPLPKPAALMFKQFKKPPGVVVLLNRPGISEAHVRMGFIGPPRSTPDYHDLEVAEAILSGPFNSRLNQSVREKGNLSYSVSAGFNYGEQMSTFVLTSSTRNDKIGELIKEVQKVLASFVNGEELTNEEVAAAKSYLQGAFPLMLQNRYTIARMYFSGLLNGLSPRFLDEYPDRVGSVTLESLKGAVKRHFHLDALQIVVAGDAKAIEPRLKKAGVRYVVRDPSDYL